MWSGVLLWPSEINGVISKKCIAHTLSLFPSVGLILKRCLCLKPVNGTQTVRVLAYGWISTYTCTVLRSTHTKDNSVTCCSYSLMVTTTSCNSQQNNHFSFRRWCKWAVSRFKIYGYIQGDCITTFSWRSDKGQVEENRTAHIFRITIGLCSELAQNITLILSATGVGHTNNHFLRLFKCVTKLPFLYNFVFWANAMFYEVWLYTASHFAVEYFWIKGLAPAAWWITYRYRGYVPHQKCRKALCKGKLIIGVQQQNISSCPPEPCFRL